MKKMKLKYDKIKVSGKCGDCGSKLIYRDVNEEDICIPFLPIGSHLIICPIHGLRGSIAKTWDETIVEDTMSDEEFNFWIAATDF